VVLPLGLDGDAPDHSTFSKNPAAPETSSFAPAIASSASCALPPPLSQKTAFFSKIRHEGC